MRMNTDALVLRVTDTGESDRLLTLLTSEYGVLRAFANRAKNQQQIHGRDSVPVLCRVLHLHGQGQLHNRRRKRKKKCSSG